VDETNLSLKDRMVMALYDGPQWPKDLADMLKTDSSTIANTSSGLRKEGLVERTGNNERNAYELRLTGAGREHYERFLSELHNSPYARSRLNTGCS